jgi:VanZ family protein
MASNRSGGGFVRSSRPDLAVRVLLPLAMMAAIFYFSAQPYDGPDLAWWEVAARKLGHIAGYAVLTYLWWWALVGAVSRPLVWAAGIALLYAASDEYHQTFVDGRHGAVEDVVIDSLGIALACTAIHLRWPRPRAAVET